MKREGFLAKSSDGAISANSRRRWMVRTDIEGASGVVSYTQAEATGPEYAEGRKYFMSDLLALLKGLDGEDVYLYDEHFYGRGIDLSQLPHGVKAICGKPPYRPDWAGGLNGTFDGLIMLAFHSKAGTPGALLPHSYELENLDIRVNGLSVGEIGVETMIAGEMGVPLALVTGDDAGCAEAGALVPGVATVVVKKGYSEFGAETYALSETAGWIAEAAKKLAEKATPLPAPYAVEKNPVMEITLAEGPYRDAMIKLYPDKFINGTVTLREGTVLANWAVFWQMKLAAQAERRRRT